MKFKIPASGINQYTHVQIIITAQVLTQLMPFISNDNAAHWSWAIKQAKKDGNETFFCFRGGAKLCWTKQGGFTIFGYHYDGNDIVCAMDELKMAYALRDASRHSTSMWENMGVFTKTPKLRATLVWPKDCGYANL